MMKILGLVFLGIGVLLVNIAVLPPTTGAEEPGGEDSWTFDGSLYIWGAKLQGTTAGGNDVDVSFSDLLDNLEFTFQGALEARKAKWSFLADVIYFDVKNEDPSRLINKVEVFAWVISPTVGYNLVDNERVSLDVRGGARYLYLKTRLGIEAVGPGGRQSISQNPSESGDVWDATIGLKGRLNLGEKWYLPFHGDIGAGDSDFTWQFFAGIGYRFKKVDLVLVYRYLDWDFDSGLALDDLNIGGPLFGIKFHF